MEHRLFITEAIKNNLAKDDLLYSATFESKGKTNDSFALTDAGNYLLLSNYPKSRIEGLIYKVSELFLIRLDRYLQSPGWCFRMPMPIQSEHGENVTAWVYMDDAEEIQ